MRNFLIVVTAWLAVAIARPAAAGNGKDLLHLAAPDADFVVSIDVADARGEAAFELLVDKLMDRVPYASQMKTLGFDVSTIDTILIAGKQGGTGEVLMVVETKTRKLPAEVTSTATARKHRGVKYYEQDDVAMGFVGKRLVVVKGGAFAAVVDRSKDRKKAKSLMRSPDASAVRGAIALADTRQHVWMAGVPASGSLGTDLSGLALGITFTADIAMEAKLILPDATAAQRFADELATQMQQLRGSIKQIGLGSFADSIQTGRQDAIVEIDATLSAQELSTVGTLLSSF